MLRTGKRLAERLTEIVITFEDVPHSIFEGAQATIARPTGWSSGCSPKESITLTILAKQPGETMRSSR